MISTSDFKKGVTIKIDSRICKIIDFQHVKPGKGGAFVKTKFRDMTTGQVLEKTFRSGEKVEDLFIENKEMQYLYKDGSDYYFMDNVSYEQIAVPEQKIGDAYNFLTENLNVFIQFCEGDIMGIELPTTVELKVTETEPGFKGNTVQGGTKKAVLETGFSVLVPLFIEEGEKLKIDTREGGKYISRA